MTTITIQAKPEEPAPNGGNKSQGKKQFDLGDHTWCCDPNPELLATLPTGTSATWAEPKLAPNARGLYCSVGVHKGSRKYMEDRHRRMFGVKGCRGYFGVFDGHGGQESSDFVARVLHQHMFPEEKHRFDTRPDAFKRELESAFERTEEKLLARQRKYNLHDGTCAVTTWIVGDTIYCANVGDSRCVMSRAGSPVALSRDHKPIDEDEKKRIIEAGGQVHPLMRDQPVFLCFGKKPTPVGAPRLWPGGFSVSRAFGNIDFKDASRGKIANPILGTLICRPEVTMTTVTRQDQFLIMASDGLWDVMSNQMAIDFVLKQLKDEKTDPELIAGKLALRAFEHGSEDNITVIVVFFTHFWQSF